MASEYGWTKDYILERVYPDEAVTLTKIIRQRIYNGKILDLAIAGNAWVKEPKKLWDILEKQVENNTKLGEETEIDHGSLQRLKNQLKNKSRAIKVK